MEEITAHGIIYGGHTLSDGAWELSMSEQSMMKKHLERLERRHTVRELGPVLLDEKIWIGLPQELPR